MASKILIIGGAGYIGSHIVKALTDADKKVVIIDNLTTGSLDNLPPDIQLIKADITDHDWASQLEGSSFDAVIHLAALTSAPESVDNPVEYKRVNSMGSSKVWRLVRNQDIKRVLYASTAAVYGDLGKMSATENSPTSPMSPYGETKLAGERSLLSTCSDSHYYSLRLFNVGGGQDSRVMGEPTVLHALTRAKTSNQPFTIYGDDHDTADGTPIRDFVHVEDVARAFAHFAISSKPFPSGIYNIGRGKGVSIKELVGNTPIKYAPRRSGDISFSIADVTKIKSTGWEPTNSLSEILA